MTFLQSATLKWPWANPRGARQTVTSSTRSRSNVKEEHQRSRRKDASLQQSRNKKVVWAEDVSLRTPILLGLGMTLSHSVLP